MSHADTSKSQATNRTSCHVPHRYQQITGNKSYIMPCLTQIPANHRQQIVLLAMPHTDTSKSQETSRISCHASHRYQQITGNKSYFLPCLTQIPANHRQQNVLLAMSHANTSKSQATNRTSCHASHRYQQITGNKSQILPCLTQIANHRQQTVLLAMSHTDTSKSQATSVSYRYQQITSNMSYCLPCLTQIPANHRQQIVLLAMSHADTSKSQATNRTSCHVSHRYQQITGNKSYILTCLTQISANHRQQIVLLAMSHADTSKSQATNRTSCHVSRRYQQITGNKSYLLPCLTQIPASHRQQIVLLAMSHADTSKSQAANRTACHVSRRYQQITGNKSFFLPCLAQIPANHRQQVVLLAMSHTDTSKSQATNRTSCHVSRRYQQITGNKSYFLPCLTQIPANHRQQIVLLAMSHRYQQITGNKPYFLPCLTQIPANHRQQIVLLATSYADTSKSQATNRTSCHVSRRYQQITGNISYFLPYLTQIPANHRQQIVLLAMSHTDTNKSQATNRTSCHVSHRYQQITGNKSYFLPCLLQIPANLRQQIVHLAMSHADTSKSQATNRTSCHVSRRYHQITGDKSYFLPCLTQIPVKSQATNRTSCHVSRRYQQITGNISYFLPCPMQIPANHRQQIVLLAMSHADTSKSQATNRPSCHVSHRYQQITGNKSYFLPCLTQIPVNHRQQIVLLAMSHTDTSKSQATNRTSCHVSRRYQQITGNKSYFLPCLTQIPANHRQQIVHLAMSHADASKSQATNRPSCHVSRRYQQITGDKSYFLPCLTQIPANHRQQIVHLAMSHADSSKSQATNRTSCHASHRYQQITGNKSYFLPCLTQIPANHTGNKSYFLPCLTHIPANHRQQIVHLAMSHTDTSKSQATNRTSCHVSHRYQQITGNKSYFLPCLTQMPANHRQQIVLLAMSHTDNSKSQATKRTACHVSRRYQQITGNKSYILPCLTQIPGNHRQQIANLAMPNTDSKSQATSSYILPCLTQIPANHRRQVILLAMSHTDTSKSQATNRISCHVSHRYQQITGDKSYFLPCLM